MENIFYKYDTYNIIFIISLIMNTHQGPYVRYISGTEQLNQLFQENQFIMVNFYATWCPSALFQQPFLIPAAEKHKTFILAIVDCDNAHNEELKKKFEIFALPAIYLLQKNIGTIISYFTGAEQNKLYEMINKIDTLRNIDPEPKIQKPNENHQGPYVRQISGVEQLTQLFYENPLIVVDFWTIGSPSCEYLKIQLIKAAQQHKTFILACVDCNDASNQALKKKFNITSIPTTFLLLNNIDSLLMNFIGANIQFVEYLKNKINKIDTKKFKLTQNDKMFKCQKGGHGLYLVTKLEPPYYGGRFVCNICRSHEKVSQQCPILHCNQCNYDVCFDCRQNPPLPKTQNDKKFKCQKGGHELYLVDKLNPPYYGGLFICNLCRSNEKVSQEYPILHCNQCNYDVCFDCRQNPPLPKTQIDKKFKCQKRRHELFLVTKLNSPYSDGQFICKICKSNEKVSKQSPILHCNQCNYDICYNCRQNPPAPKNYNQNDKMFICQKGGHELFLVTKLDPPYYGGQFICNICRNSDIVSQQYPILHCNQCNYDVCFDCRQNPPLPKTQNDKKFKCQKGGHELYLVDKLNPPYYGGLFICNLCRSNEKVSQEYPILHCNQCNYDVCFDCRQNPPLPKTQIDKKFKCQKRRHELFLVTKLNSPYSDGQFICKICKSNEKVSKQSPILHCNQCNYDICYNCRQNPPAPKNYNQNDKMFICQKGGHELFLVTKLDPPYYGGQFICNICRNSDIVSQQYPILHCNQCNYDVCFDCRQNPPLPKTQNDKKFKCQKGGHELYLVDKLNPPYYGGLFICNLCRSNEKVSQEYPILHCNQCNYDVCFDCRQNPPLPKTQIDKKFKCQKRRHELFLVTKLNSPYSDGQFICKICKSNEKVSKQSPILHCNQCNYDICYNCRQNPPAPKNYNQNDKMFICQKGGHELFLVTKLDPPYYGGQFICNICRNSDIVSQQYPILHCNQCNYDVCFDCRQNPPLPKTQNDKKFKCQKGGHELYLVDKLNPPYYGGLFICNLCRSNEKVSQEYPILHCNQCNYDVCFDCRQKPPPEPKIQKPNENHQGPYVRQISGVEQLTQLFNQNQFVIVDFWAPWCPPCVKFKPQLIKAAQQHKIFILACVNCDDPSNLPLKKKFAISSIPAVFLLHNNINTISSQFVGADDEEFGQMIETINVLRNEKIKIAPPLEEQKPIAHENHQVLNSNKEQPKLKNKTFYCRQQHQLVLTTVLPNPPYGNQIYCCDLCQYSGVVSEQAPMLHCDICKYDVCYRCCHE